MNRTFRTTLPLALACLALAACSDDNPVEPACDAVMCAATPPALTCSEDGQDLIRPTRFIGCADDGGCEYLFQSTSCPGGCEDGACLPACHDVTCAEPSAPRCSGNTLVERALPGTPDPNSCDCSYEQVRTDCGDDVCFDGECRPFECAFLTCDEPPADTCDGDVAVSYPAAGTCDASSRSCTYEETREDCAARGESCRQGACTDACAGVSCNTPPRDSCDGDIAVQYDATGACAEGGCSYESERIDCAAEDARCVSGACEPLCEDSACILPPSPQCIGSTAVVYAATGTCNSENTCSYQATTTNCADDGLVCSNGVCREEPTCLGVTCAFPPDDACVGDIATTYPEIGICEAGPTCTYPPVTQDCTLSGQVCFAAECENFCDVDTCVTPPEDTCEGDVAVVYTGTGTCDDGTQSCDYGEFEIDCALSGQRCFEGDCVGDCVAEECDAPPAPTCVGDTVYTYNTLGYCDDGACAYEFSPTENCADSGEVCVAGACMALCDGVACNDPPAATCDDEVLVTFGPAATCESDTCTYAESRRACDAEGLACITVDGEADCRDACDGFLECTVPDPICDGDELVVFAAPVGCEDSECVFSEGRIDCAARGDVCFDGACVDACIDVTCDDPPADSCDDSVASAYRPSGVCVRGECEYVADETDCALALQTCVEGACVDSCDEIVCDDPPEDGCDEEGRNVVWTDDDGICVGGECRYFRQSSVVCADFGQVCEVDACVSPCAGVTCDDPPAASCDDDIVLGYANPGACDGGTCSYPPSAADCQAVGGVCEGTRCVFDACDGVTCSEPTPACDGNVAVTPSASAPRCTESECVFELVRTDCLRTGRLCSGGACVSTGDVCAALDCGPQPPTCDGDVVVSRPSAGTCVPGPPTSCDYATTESRVACTGGQGCFDGSCVDVPQAGELTITELHINPDGTDLHAEWFELKNTGGTTLQLAGVTISSDFGEITLPAIELAADGYLVLGSADDLAPTVDVVYPYFALPVGNDADTLRVARGATPIDEVAFDATWAIDGGGLTLDADSEDASSNDVRGSWCVLAPSPGAARSCVD